MIGNLIDAILGLRGLVAYSVVGLLAFGEAAAFVGLVLPGEIAVLLGGVLASQQRVSLVSMLLVANVAAVAGDSAGYELGRHFGTRVLRLGWMQRHESKLHRAERYLQQRGGRAVLLGRWTSVLRALVPGLAGMARMPYGQFLVYNVIGGVAWATAFTLLGYVAGASFRQVERVAGRASLILLGLLLAGFALRWAARRLSTRQEQVRALVSRLAETGAGRWVRRRYTTQLRWLAERFDPRLQQGLGLTFVLVALVAAGWAVGAVTQDVFGRDELALLDAPTARWFAAQRTPVALTVSRWLLAVVELPWLALTVAVTAVAVAAWRRSRRSGAQVLTAAVGGWMIARILQALLPVSSAGRPFPSVTVMVTSALMVAVTGLVAQARGWVAGVRWTAGAAMVIALVATAHPVRGDGALSGVVGGAALGTFWALALFAAEHAATNGSAAPPIRRTAGA